MIRKAIGPLSFVALTACAESTTSPDFQENGLQEVLGEIAYADEDALSDGTAGYFLQVGLNADQTELLAEADLAAPSDLADPPVTGSAEMSGPLQLRAYVNPNSSSGSLTATGVSRTSTIDATVNFERRTLVAQSGSGAAALTIDGVFANDGTLSGSTTYLGIAGELGGDVSGDAAVGVFEGSSSLGVYAGGFLVEN